MVICLVILMGVFIGVIIYNFVQSSQEVEFPETAFTESEMNKPSQNTESVVESGIDTELESENPGPLTDTEIPPKQEQILYPNHEDVGEEQQYTKADFVINDIPKELLEHLSDVDQFSDDLWQAAVDQGIGSFNRASYVLHTTDPYQTGLPIVYIIMKIHSVEARYITTVLNTAEDTYSFIADMTNGTGEYIEYVPIDPKERASE